MSRLFLSKQVLRNSGLAALALVALVSCGDRNIILPGERLSIRPQENVVVTNRAAAISLGAPVSNANWLQKNYSPSHQVPHLALAAVPSLRWSVDIGRGNSDRSRITSEPVIANGVIYTLDAAGSVRAMSAQGGGMIWSADITPIDDVGGAEGFGGGLALDGNSLYVGTGFGELLALSTENGAVRWRYGFDAPIRSAPTVAAGRVFVVTRDDVAYGIDTAHGALSWTLAGPRSSNAMILGGASIAVSGQNVVIPFSSGQIIGATTGGTGRWRGDVNTSSLSTVRGTIGEVSGDPVISGGRVFVSNQGGQTTAINLTNGSESWSVAEGALGPAAVIGGSVFTVTDHARLMRIDASTGAVIWAVQLPEYKNDNRRRGFIVHHGPIVAGGQVIVAGTDGQLRFFDPVSGAATGARAIPGGAASGPVVAAGVLYVQSQNGKLHAFQ